MKSLPFRELDPIPPQIADDPKDANVDALKDHSPVLGVYARGKDIDTGEDMVAEIVDGPWIRTNLWIDFTAGGNPSRYPWIEKNHYWLDNGTIAEADYDLIHETVECLEMRDKKLSYGSAHSRFANSEEYQARKDPSQIVSMLRSLGWMV